VPCGPIHAIDQMFENAQVEHLGIAQDALNAENRDIRLVGHLSRDRAAAVCANKKPLQKNKDAVTTLHRTRIPGWLHAARQGSQSGPV
jgi:hypothetical protein